MVFSPFCWDGKVVQHSEHMSVIRRLMVCANSVSTTSTIHLLFACHHLAPASATRWFIKGCYRVLSCLFDNACKISLAICGKSRTSCPLACPYIACMRWTRTLIWFKQINSTFWQSLNLSWQTKTLKLCVLSYPGTSMNWHVYVVNMLRDKSSITHVSRVESGKLVYQSWFAGIYLGT